jgi:hypothetical protein
MDITPHCAAVDGKAPLGAGSYQPWTIGVESPLTVTPPTLVEYQAIQYLTPLTRLTGPCRGSSLYPFTAA